MKKFKFNLITWIILMNLLILASIIFFRLLFTGYLTLNDWAFPSVVTMSLVLNYFLFLYIHELAHYGMAKFLKYEAVNLQARGLRIREGQIKIIGSEFFDSNVSFRDKFPSAEGIVAFKPRLGNTKKEKQKMVLVLLAAPTITLLAFLILIFLLRYFTLPFIWDTFFLSAALLALFFTISSVQGDVLMAFEMRNDDYYYCFSIGLCMHSFSIEELKELKMFKSFLEALQHSFQLEKKSEKMTKLSYVQLLYALVEGSFIVGKQFFDEKEIKTFLILYEKRKNRNEHGLLAQNDRLLHQRLTELGYLNTRNEEV